MKRRTDLDRTVRINLAEAGRFAFCVEGQGSATEGEWLDACDDMDRIIEQVMPDFVEVVDQAYLVDPRRIEITGYAPPNNGDCPEREPETWTIRLEVIGEQALVGYARRYYAAASLGASGTVAGEGLARSVGQFLGHGVWYATLDATEDGYVTIFDDESGVSYRINVESGTITTG
jgi:hypothetical protein